VEHEYLELMHDIDWQNNSLKACMISVWYRLIIGQDYHHGHDGGKDNGTALHLGKH